MPLITIKEESIQSGEIKANVSLDHGIETLVTLQDPFSEDEEKRLAWCKT